MTSNLLTTRLLVCEGPTCASTVESEPLESFLDLLATLCREAAGQSH